MGDYGLFEADAHAQAEPERQQRVAAAKLMAAIDAVRRDYGRHLAAATGVDDFDDRWNFARHDIRASVKEHIPPVSGVMRRVKNAMKAEWKRTAAGADATPGGAADLSSVGGPASATPLTPATADATVGHNSLGNGSGSEVASGGSIPSAPVGTPGPIPGFPTGRQGSQFKGAPFATYKDFKDCVSSNSDKDDPHAYCGYIKHQTEDKKTSSHRQREASIRLELSRNDLQAAFAELGAMERWAGPEAPTVDPPIGPYVDPGSTFTHNHLDNNYGPMTDLGRAMPNQALTGSRTAGQDGHEPELHTEQTYQEHEDENLIPEGDFDGYLSEVDQGAPAKVQRNFGEGGDTGSDKHGSRTASQCPECGQHLHDEYARLGHGHDPQTGEVFNAPPQAGHESLGDYQKRFFGGAKEGDEVSEQGKNLREHQDDYAEKRKETTASIALDLYTDWATSNGLRCASRRTLQAYAELGISDADYHEIEASIRHAEIPPQFRDDDDDDDDESRAEDAEDEEEDIQGHDGDSDDDDSDEDEDDDDESDDEDSDDDDDDEDDEDEGDDEGGEDEGDGPDDRDDDSDRDDDDRRDPPWITSSHERVQMQRDMAWAVKADMRRLTADNGSPPGTAPGPGTGGAQMREIGRAGQSANGMASVPGSGLYGTGPLSPAGDLPRLSRRQAAFPDDQQDDGGGQPPPDQGAAQEAPQAPAAPPQAPPGPQAAPPGPQGAPSGPMENQPAEDALLGTAADAVMQMIDKETQEYQTIIDPLTQALQAIEFAQQVEQAEHPLDVTPPQGTVDVTPSAAAGGAQDLQKQQLAANMRWLQAKCDRTGSPYPVELTSYLARRFQAAEAQRQRLAKVLPQMARIAKAYGMPRSAVKMVLTAMGRRQYEHVSEALNTLPPGMRPGIAASLADMFVQDNPHFKHGPFYQSVGLTASRRRAAEGDVPWGPLQGPIAHPFHDDPEMQRHLPDEGWDWDKLHEITRNDPGAKYGPELGPYHPGADMQRYVDAEPGSLEKFDQISRDMAQREMGRTSRRRQAGDAAPFGEAPGGAGPEGQQAYGGGDWNPDSPIGAYRNFADAKWNGEVSHNSLRDYMDHIGPHRFEPGELGPLINHVDSIALGRQAKMAASWTPEPELSSFKFPTSKAPSVNDNIAVDNLPGTTPTGNASAKASPVKPVKPITTAASVVEAKNVMDLWNSWSQGHASKGLNMGGEPDLESFANETKVGPKALNTVKQNLGVGSPSTKTSSWSGSFFTRRVPGWRWDDHQNGYITSSRRPFECSCGADVPTPSFTNCRCGKIWYSYPIATSADHLASNTADMFIAREIPARKEAEAANRAMAQGLPAFTAHRHTADCGCEESEGQVWIEDEDRGKVDVGHAPAPRKQGAQQCDYCGGHGHDWRVHPEAHADVAAWDRERAQLEEPFGQHVESRKQGGIGSDDHDVVYRDGERFCSKCNALLWDPNVHHCPAKQAGLAQRLLAAEDDGRLHGPFAGYDDWEDCVAQNRDKGDPDKYCGEIYHQVEEGRKRKGEPLSGHQDKESRFFMADWTVYDDDVPNGGPGRPPSTDVKQPPADWARRDGKGNWVGPTVPRTKSKD